jgi:hypothetical protein
MTQNTSHAVMTQRSEPHDSLDDFPTPPWAVRAFLEWLDPRPTAICWEPAANRGYMVKALRERFAAVYASDVHDYCVGFHVHDFLMPGAALDQGALDHHQPAIPAFRAIRAAGA